MTQYDFEIRRIRRLSRMLLVLTTLLFAVLAVYAWGPIRNRLFPVEGRRPITERGPLMSFENVTIDVVKKASPSVVFITTETQRRNPYNRNIEDVRQGSGSGFIWDDTGHIVTNYHVIENPNAIIHVILSDQTVYEAKLLGADPSHDLAVVKINPALGVRLVPIPIGTSSDLQVGQSAFAIGNPFGLDQSVTTGIVSALQRSITAPNGDPLENVIQTDAAINPGNSGGPLLDSAARLIGVNTAIATQSGVFSGIGFAIPVDTAYRVIPELIKNGKYQRARLGISYNEDLQRLIPKDVQGLAISSIEANSPAAAAGLAPATSTFGPPTQGRRGFRGTASVVTTLGDIVTQINSKPVKTPADVFTIMDHITPGDTVDVTLYNNGETRHVKIATTP